MLSLIPIKQICLNVDEVNAKHGGNAYYSNPTQVCSTDAFLAERTLLPQMAATRTISRLQLHRDHTTGELNGTNKAAPCACPASWSAESCRR